MRGEGLLLALRLQVHVQCPVFFRDEGIDLIFPVGNHPQCHGLNTSGGQAALDFRPQQRGNAVAHHPVQNAACLLCVHQACVDFSGVPNGFRDRALCNLVERDPEDLMLLHKILQPQRRDQMPRDCFSLAVRVRCQIYFIRFLHQLAQRSEQLALSADRNIFRFVVMLHIDAELTFGQVADMPHAGGDLILRAQEFLDRLHLRR